MTTIAERLANVTVEDVARVIRTYLASERRTIVIAEPEAGAADPDADVDDEDGEDDA